MTSLQKLWKYNNWANDRIFKTFDHFRETVPPGSIRFLSHIVNTQASWLLRLRGEHSTIDAWAIHNLDECKHMHAEASAGYKKLLDNPADDLERIIHYKNSAGQSYQNTVHDIILHAMNHGTYHRGQIAMDMRQHGLEPTNTDYIMFLR